MKKLLVAFLISLSGCGVVMDAMAYPFHSENEKEIEVQEEPDTR